MAKREAGAAEFCRNIWPAAGAALIYVIANQSDCLLVGVGVSVGVRVGVATLASGCAPLQFVTLDLASRLLRRVAGDEVWRRLASARIRFIIATVGARPNVGRKLARLR